MAGVLTVDFLIDFLKSSGIFFRQKRMPYHLGLELGLIWEGVFLERFEELSNNLFSRDQIKFQVRLFLYHFLVETVPEFSCWECRKKNRLAPSHSRRDFIVFFHFCQP